MQFPLGKKLSGVWEPTVAATVVTPSEHLGSIMELFQERRGEMLEHTVLSPARTLLRHAPCHLLTRASHMLLAAHIPVNLALYFMLALLLTSLAQPLGSISSIRPHTSSLCQTV